MAARSAARRWDRAGLGPSSLSLAPPLETHPPRLRGSFTAGRQVRSGVCPYLGRSPLDKDASHSKRSGGVFRGIWHNARLPPPLYLRPAFVDVDSGDGSGGCYGDERGPKTIRFHSTVIGSRSRSPGVRGSALLKAERVLCNELPPTTASRHGFPPFSRPPRPLRNREDASSNSSRESISRERERQICFRAFSRHVEEIWIFVFIIFSFSLSRF